MASVASAAAHGAIVVTIGQSHIELTRGFDETLLRAVVDALSERAS
jgi:hypothetical protein